MPTSSRDLKKLRAPAELQTWCRTLALLDLILSPDDWESRAFSYDAAWGNGDAMFQMRDGSGDHLFVLFRKDGSAALRGFAHESAMSPWSSARKKATGKPTLWPGLFAGLPSTLADIRDEPAFGGEEITFCAWWSPDRERAWRIGDLQFPNGKDPDGSETLLEMLVGSPADYARWASEYVDRDVPLAVVKKLCALPALTEALVSALNPEATLDDVRDEAMSIGVAIASASPAKKKRASPAKKRPAKKKSVKKKSAKRKSAKKTPAAPAKKKKRR